ncbi:MAG: hypothetical protein CMC05_14820 [Flavobacteriaceae bacterium]|nr:hypothetical protein [Flavobacteriaceae bacterium]
MKKPLKNIIMSRIHLTLLLFLGINLLFGQENKFEENIYSFSSIKLESKIKLEPQLDSIYNTISKKQSFSLHDVNPMKYNFELNELNNKLFSNFEIIENTYFDYKDYLRGCGPLQDGITNNVNTGDLMLSMFLDNLVNNYIFKGKGVFFKK